MDPVSFNIPAGSLPPDFDPNKPIRVHFGRAVMPAFDRSKYGGLDSPPKDPADPDTGEGFDPDDPDGIDPNPDGGGGGDILSGNGSLSARLKAIENFINFGLGEATLDIVCNEDGTITGTIIFGSLPS